VGPQLIKLPSSMIKTTNTASILNPFFPDICLLLSVHKQPSQSTPHYPLNIQPDDGTIYFESPPLSGAVSVWDCAQLTNSIEAYAFW
ncbi:MAG TPA: hypothetical protein VLY63_30300, partial [Anaerolineae bacterium]|nr:hypothetical protein [Anaerolineae bacterium]